MVEGGTKPPESGGPGSLPGSQAAVVLTSLHESREAGTTGALSSGEVGRVKTHGVAKAPVQVEEEDVRGGNNLEKGGRGEQECLQAETQAGSEWKTVGRRQNKGTGKTQPQEQNRERLFVYEQREGDWRCQSRGCEDFMNFKRRMYCMKCKRDINGEITRARWWRKGQGKTE